MLDKEVHGVKALCGDTTGDGVYIQARINQGCGAGTQIFGPGSRTIWSIKTKNHCIILYSVTRFPTNHVCWTGTQISNSGSTALVETDACAKLFSGAIDRRRKARQ